MRPRISIRGCVSRFDDRSDGRSVTSFFNAFNARISFIQEKWGRSNLALLNVHCVLGVLNVVNVLNMLKDGKDAPLVC